MGRIEQAKKYYNEIEVPSEFHQRIKQTIKKERRKQIRKRAMHFVTAGAAAVLLIIMAELNTNAVFAKEVSQIPVIGKVAQILTFRSFNYETDMASVSAKIPGVEIDSVTVKEQKYSNQVNAAIQKKCDAYIKAAIKRVEDYKKAFLETGGTKKEFEEKKIVIKVDYEIKSETKERLSFAVIGTESWVSAYAMTDYYNLDLKSQKPITLKDVLGKNYISIANEQIKEQMKEQEQNQNIKYWEDDQSKFKSIKKDTDFYLDADGNPVIVFQKYEIGPGSIGRVEFTIHKTKSQANTVPNQSDTAQDETSTAVNETNTAVNQEVSFAEKIKDAIDHKDKDKLADMMAYPTYIGIDDGIVVKDKEEFQQLNSTKLFADEMIDMVDHTNFSTIVKVQAGYVYGEGKTNIIFSMDEKGIYKITGMNYQ